MDNSTIHGSENLMIIRGDNMMCIINHWCLKSSKMHEYWLSCAEFANHIPIMYPTTQMWVRLEAELENLTQLIQSER